MHLLLSNLESFWLKAIVHIVVLFLLFLTLHSSLTLFFFLNKKVKHNFYCSSVKKAALMMEPDDELSLALHFRIGRSQFLGGPIW